MSHEETRLFLTDLALWVELFLDGWLNANINGSYSNVVIAKVIERYTYTAIPFLEQSPHHKTLRGKIEREARESRSRKKPQLIKRSKVTLV